MTIHIGKKKYTTKEIAADIEAYIADTSSESNMPLTPSSRLALKYNVSSRTVERALAALVHKGLIYRIQGKGTFIAKQRVKKRNKSIGYFAWQHNDHSALNEAAYGTFECNLIGKLKELGFYVDFIVRAGYREKIIDITETMRYDLLIIPSGMITAQTLPWLKKLPIPVVVINCIEVLPYSFHQVCFHYEPGFEKAVAYLNKRGVKNIFLAGVNTETTNARAEVLKKVATASKISVQTLEFENPQQADIGTSMTVLAGRKHGKYFLDNKLDGVIFTLSDFIALGIIDIAKERNLELGKDIRIISYDNLESRLPCTENQKLITSINHPLEELAAESVQLCNEVISNTTASGVTKIRRVPSKDLIIRKSFY